MSKDTIPYGWEILDAADYAFRPTKELAEKVIEKLSAMQPSMEFSYVYSPTFDSGKGSYIIINKMHPLNLAEYEEARARYLASKKKDEERLKNNKTVWGPDRKKKKSTKPKIKRCKCK